MTALNDFMLGHPTDDQDKLMVQLLGIGMFKSASAVQGPGERSSVFACYFPLLLRFHALMIPHLWMCPVRYLHLARGRAGAAFRKLETRSKQITIGRLRYTFEYTAEGPRLKMVALA